MPLDTAKTADVVTRLVARLRVMVREEIAHSRMIVRRRGEVVAVNVGPPASVDITIGGSDVTVPGVRYMASYSPTVADIVWVDLIGDDPLVIGKQA